jgi:hypothetical protein
MKVIFLDHDGVICLAPNWGSRFKKEKKLMRGKAMPEYLSSSFHETLKPVDVRFDNFDKKAIEVLNEILKETDAEIVVSSDWKRFATVEEMGEYYESQGIIKKPIAFTGSITSNNYDDFPWEYRMELEQTRSLEIAEYLTNYQSITEWVAIDDLNMSLRRKEDGEYSWGLNNFVLTPSSNEGIKQSGIKEKVIGFLTKKPYEKTI